MSFVSPETSASRRSRGWALGVGRARLGFRYLVLSPELVAILQLTREGPSEVSRSIFLMVVCVVEEQRSGCDEKQEGGGCAFANVPENPSETLAPRVQDEVCRIDQYKRGHPPERLSACPSCAPRPRTEGSTGESDGSVTHYGCTPWRG